MIVINARFLTQKLTGVQRFAGEISVRLKELLPGIVFVSPGNILNDELAKKLDVRIIGKKTGLLWEQFELPAYLKKQGSPLLVNLGNTGVLNYSRQIVTIHDMSYQVNPAWFSKKFYLWYAFLIPRIASKSLKIITVSESSKNDIVKYLKTDPDKIAVVYNASYLQGNATRQPATRGRYILTVSSLEPRKNLDRLVEAAKQIDSDVKLVIVGLGNTKTFSHGFNNGSPAENIIVKGYVSDNELAELMSGAQALVYVSLYEGFGLPPVEAMTMHCPIVVSNIPVHKEICGDAAIYVDPYNVNDICTGIQLLLNDNVLAETLVANGLKNIKRFSWSVSAKKTFDIINETLQTNN